MLHWTARFMYAHSHLHTQSHTQSSKYCPYPIFVFILSFRGCFVSFLSLFAFSTVPFKFFWISFKVLFFWKRKLTIKCHSAICLFSCEISPKTHLNRNIFFYPKTERSEAANNTFRMLLMLSLTLTLWNVQHHFGLFYSIILAHCILHVVHTVDRMILRQTTTNSIGCTNWMNSTMTKCCTSRTDTEE